jgi:hypothetical protein
VVSHGELPHFVEAAFDRGVPHIHLDRLVVDLLDDAAG